MKTLLFTTAWILVTASLAPAQRPDADMRPVIVVNGNSEVRIAPDEATVRVGIVRQASSAQQAQQQASLAAQEILKAVMAAGVPAAQIQTSRLTLTPVYAPRRPDAAEAPRIVAYNAQNVVSVRLEDLALVGPVIDAGLRAGANQLEGVQFGLRNELPSREKALKEAVVEARKKAEAMAEALNVRLAGVLEVTEGGVSVSKLDLALAGRAQQESFASFTPVAPGELEVQANVTIRFLIDQQTSR
jgi:uncharacterized protein YggE